MKFGDIPQRQKDGNYRVNVPWNHLKSWIKSNEELNIQLEPDFQRTHVWTDDQKSRYVEFKLSGGPSSSEIRWNCKGWMRSFEGPFVLVDGLQRITAVLDFLDDKVKAFGKYYSEYEGPMSLNCNFSMIVNNIENYSDVLKWYVEINDGGTPHTEEELNKVRKMLGEIK